MYHSLKVSTDIAHGLTCRRLLRGTSLVLTTVLEIKVMAVCRSLVWALPVIRPARFSRHHYTKDGNRSRLSKTNTNAGGVMKLNSKLGPRSCR